MILNMYIYAQGMGWQPLWDKFFMPKGTSCPFGHLLQVSKTSLVSLILYIFFMILYMYISPGLRQTAPWGHSFDVNRNVLSLHSFVASFKTNVFEVWFYTFFFHDLIHVYSPRAGQTASRGQNFDVNRKALSIYSFVASFKKNLFEVWFYTIFFHDFIHVSSPKAGADNPLGMKFLCQQEHLGTLVICCKFQKNLFEGWFYTILFIFYTCI